MEPCYTLRIDGPLLRSQRLLLARLIEAASDNKPYVCENDDRGLLEGILALLNELADQAHDRYGIDCLEEEPPDDGGRCECELPGYFHCGVPGNLARVEHGKLVPGAEVQRCDLCQRYPSDEAAYQKLKELGYV